MGFSNYAQNKLIDFMRGQALALPANWYVAPGFVTGGGVFTECHGTGYARQAMPRSLATWSGTQGAGTTTASSGSSHTSSNNAAIAFGTPGSAWGNVNRLYFYDALTFGNQWFACTLVTPFSVVSGLPLSFNANTVQCVLGSTGGMSDYLSNNLLDLLLRGQAYNWPATTYLGLYTTAPTNAGGGVEVGGGSSYARVGVASSLANWCGTQGAGTTTASTGTTGRTSNNGILTYPSPTADWGVTLAEGMFDAASAGNLLFWDTLDLPGSVVAGGAAPRHAANSFFITLS